MNAFAGSTSIISLLAILMQLVALKDFVQLLTG
jgi:hypothetical protein